MDARRIAALAAVMALMLGSCDNKPKAHQDTGNHAVVLGNTKVEVKGEGSSDRVELPSNMPAYAAIYPGADVRSYVSTSNGGPFTAMITYRTKGPPADVIAFYKKQAAAAGLTTSQETNLGTLWTFGAQRGQSQLTVAMVAENGEYSVQETYR